MFNNLYSNSEFLLDLAFKKIFLETPQLLNYVYNYTLELLDLPIDDSIHLLDNNVNDNINIKNRESDLLYESDNYLINIEGNSQTSVSVNLKNLSYLCALLLRQVKPGDADKVKKVLQININNKSPFKTKNFINITELIDSITNEVRNELFFIVDFNLENSYNMTYNEIASLPGDDPRKIFYVFTSENNDKYYELYKNNKLGQLILRRMEYMVENFDAIFYYDRDKFNEQVAKEVGFEEGKTAGIEIGKTAGIEIGKTEGMTIGIDKGKKEIILNLLKAGMNELDIMKYLGITESGLEEIKKCK
ncbi:MAG: hypothetical protein SPE00_04790 [Bacilli bacterium]|nr:hypothetical protein [Bacilli bacterium]